MGIMFKCIEDTLDVVLFGLMPSRTCIFIFQHCLADIVSTKSPPSAWKPPPSCALRPARLPAHVRRDVLRRLRRHHAFRWGTTVTWLASCLPLHVPRPRPASVRPSVRPTSLHFRSCECRCGRSLQRSTHVAPRQSRQPFLQRNSGKGPQLEQKPRVNMPHKSQWIPANPGSHVNDPHVPNANCDHSYRPEVRVFHVDEVLELLAPPMPIRCPNSETMGWNSAVRFRLPRLQHIAGIRVASPRCVEKDPTKGVLIRYPRGSGGPSSPSDALRNLGKPRAKAVQKGLDLQWLPRVALVTKELVEKECPKVLQPNVASLATHKLLLVFSARDVPDTPKSCRHN